MLGNARHLRLPVLLRRSSGRRRRRLCTGEKRLVREPSLFSPSPGEGDMILRLSGAVSHDPALASSLERSLSSASLGRLRTALLTLEGEGGVLGAKSVRVPTPRELGLVALESAIPFVGFGLIDNAVMIVAGDYIDVTFGVALGISTMAAAGLGNLVSDVMGVGLGGIVESWAARVGIPVPDLTMAQSRLRVTRYARHFGSAVGVTIGCLLGMFPLLFMDTGRAEELKQEARVDELFGSVVQYVHEAVDAESATLFLVDKEARQLWTRAASAGSELPETLPLDKGLVGRCAMLGQTVNESDAYRSKDFNRTIDASSGFKTKSALCTPVIDQFGGTIGVLQVINSKHGGAFTKSDERLLGSLAAHISVAVENAVSHGEAKLGLIASLRAAKEHHENQNKSRRMRRGSVDKTQPNDTPPAPLRHPTQRAALLRKDSTLLAEERRANAEAGGGGGE